MCLLWLPRELQVLLRLAESFFRFRSLSPEDEPRCWSSPTWMPAPCSTLPPPPPRWPPSYPPTLSGSTYLTRSNLTGKVLFWPPSFKTKNILLKAETSESCVTLKSRCDPPDQLYENCRRPRYPSPSSSPHYLSTTSN